jgi:putative endonuclease
VSRTSHSERSELERRSGTQELSFDRLFGIYHEWTVLRLYPCQSAQWYAVRRSDDLVRRISEHRAKLVPGFTRKYGINQLVYFEEYGSILEARAREHAVKRWRRVWKIALIEKMNPSWRDLSLELML